MKRRRISQSLKEKILKESMVAGCKVASLARSYKISGKTLYGWRRMQKDTRIEETVALNNKFVEVLVDPEVEKASAIINVKKALLEFDRFTISIEGKFNLQHLNQVVQIGGKSC